MTPMTMPAISPPDKPLEAPAGTNVAFPEAAGTGVPNPVVTVGEIVDVMMTPVTEVPLVPAVAPVPVTVYTAVLAVQVSALQYSCVEQQTPPQGVVMPAQFGGHVCTWVIPGTHELYTKVLVTVSVMTVVLVQYV
jgi:hypothetical protein